MDPMDGPPARLDLGIVLGLAYGAFVDELHEHMAQDGFGDLRRSDGYVFRTLAAGERSTAACRR